MLTTVSGTVGGQLRQVSLYHLSAPISSTCGVRQGDALACLLFNVTLEKIIQDSGIQTRGTIFSKTVQILAYVGDIDLMARTTPGLSEAFLNLEKSARPKDSLS
jgi:sorting nexin-29